MALLIDGLIFDELTSDPVSPVEGEVWFNTTDNRLKLYNNGAVTAFISKLEFDNHVNDLNNPHDTDLEEARSAGNTLSGSIDMGGNQINNLGAPTSASDAATQQYVKDQVDQKLRGWDWQESVLDRDLTAPPGSPAVGDRYIVASGGTGLWSGLDDQIVEWDGTVWQTAVPNEGYATRVEDEDILIIHDGTNWGAFGSAVDHGSLIGLGDDDHTQYLLVDGTRAMTGNLNMGGNNITNVGTVDGVDIATHAARHIDGGADPIDADKLEISYSPTNYTPTTSPTEVDQLDQLTAHLAGIDSELAGVGMFLPHKAGKVLPGAFTGKTATVTFSAAFADADYSVQLTATTTGGKSYKLSAESQVAGSFVINKNTTSVSGLTHVNWTAVKHGEAS